MKKVFQWLYSNKVTLTGFLALILYVLDQIFKFSEDLNLAQEIYYTIASIIVLIIGYAIRGRGFESIEEFKEACEKHKRLKESKSLIGKLEVIDEIIGNNKENGEEGSNQKS